MAAALFDSLLVSGGGVVHPPQISKTTGRMTMKVLRGELLPEVKYHREARNKKKLT